MGWGNPIRSVQRAVSQTASSVRTAARQTTSSVRTAVRQAEGVVSKAYDQAEDVVSTAAKQIARELGFAPSVQPSQQAMVDVSAAPQASEELTTAEGTKKKLKKTTITAGTAGLQTASTVGATTAARIGI